MTTTTTETAKAKTAKARSAPVRLDADYWDEGGDRHRKGATIDLPAAAARDLIAAGKAERADPLPGEDA